MMRFSFRKRVSSRPYGVHVGVRGTEGLFIAIPERVRRCVDVEECLTMFLDTIEKELRCFMQMAGFNVDDREIEGAICANLELISAVTYCSRGSVLTDAYKLGD